MSGPVYSFWSWITMKNMTLTRICEILNASCCGVRLVHSIIRTLLSRGHIPVRWLCLRLSGYTVQHPRAQVGYVVWMETTSWQVSSQRKPQHHCVCFFQHLGGQSLRWQCVFWFMEFMLQTPVTEAKSVRSSLRDGTQIANFVCKYIDRKLVFMDVMITLSNCTVLIEFTIGSVYAFE